MRPDPVALVTGASRGIGFELCRQLARIPGATVVLTARSQAKADAAKERLAAEGLTLVARELDVSSAESARALARRVEDEQGRLDVLVNNAGIMPDKRDSAEHVAPDVVRQALETNLIGPLQVCQAFLPLMRRHGYGRIVNVSSQLGSLAEMGGLYPGYRMSKTALNALTRILSAELLGTNILVNACCPGWVQTEMGGPRAPRPVEQAADTILWLASLPDDGPRGGFFRDREPLPW